MSIIKSSRAPGCSVSCVTKSGLVIYLEVNPGAVAEDCWVEVFQVQPSTFLWIDSAIASHMEWEKRWIFIVYIMTTTDMVSI